MTIIIVIKILQDLFIFRYADHGQNLWCYNQLTWRQVRRDTCLPTCAAHFDNCNQVLHKLLRTRYPRCLFLILLIWFWCSINCSAIMNHDDTFDESNISVDENWEDGMYFFLWIYVHIYTCITVYMAIYCDTVSFLCTHRSFASSNINVRPFLMLWQMWFLQQ